MTTRSLALLAGLSVLLVAAAVVPALATDDPVPVPSPSHPAKEPSGDLIQAQTPPFSEGVFPCTGCHEAPGDPARRELGFHNEIQAIFTHGVEGRWCLDCHSNVNRDFLHLTGGDLVPFTESYRLCGQCHGDKYRDWRAGVHGKRVGRWNGAKSYFLCVNCHNPHAPRFQGVEEIVVDGRPTVSPTLTPLQPMPPPVRPENMKR